MRYTRSSTRSRVFFGESRVKTIGPETTRPGRDKGGIRDVTYCEPTPIRAAAITTPTASAAELARSAASDGTSITCVLCTRQSIAVGVSDCGPCLVIVVVIIIIMFSPSRLSKNLFFQHSLRVHPHTVRDGGCSPSKSRILGYCTPGLGADYDSGTSSSAGAPNPTPRRLGFGKPSTLDGRRRGVLGTHPV